MSLRVAPVFRRVSGETREFLVFGASTFIYQGGRFVFSLAAAAVLLAADFSAWAVILSLLVYAPSLLMGVTNGMSRELPIHSGSGKEGAAQRAAQAAWSATFAAVAAAIGLSVGAAVIIASSAGTMMVVGVLASGSIIYFTSLSILRSRLRFHAASAQQTVFGVTALLLSALLVRIGDVSLTIVAGYYGLCIVVSVSVGVLLARPKMPIAWDPAELLRLARIGFPIMLAGLLFSVYVTLDRWVAIALLGAERAAPYALASLFAAAALVVPSVVSQQMYPRMGIARGKGATAPELRAIAREQGRLAAGLVIPIVFSISLFAWTALPIVLPEFSEAGGPMVVLSFGLLILALMTGYGNYLNVVGGQWRYLGAQVVGLAASMTMMLIGGASLGLIGIAGGMAAGHVVYGLALLVVADRTEIRRGPTTDIATEAA